MFIVQLVSIAPRAICGTEFILDHFVIIITCD